MMQTMKKYNFLIFLFFISCTNLSKNLESNVNNSFISKNNEFCSLENNYFLSENSQAISFTKSNFNRPYIKNRNFIDQFLLMNLIELIRRPDVVSPHSRLQIIGKYNNKFLFLDFKQKIQGINSFPFLYGLHYMATNYSNTKLETLADEIDQNLDNVIPVDIELENFIKSNRMNIFKNNTLASNYFRADEPITHFENYNKMKIYNFVKSLNIKKQFNDINYTVTDELNNKHPINCNFDYKNENNFDYLKANIKKESTHYFGIKSDQNYLMAIISNLEIDDISNIENTVFFKKDFPINPVPICLIQNKSNHIFLASIEGRAKNQHLSHLIDYDIAMSKDINALIDILNFPRHLFLTNPDRILYEANRGRNDQLNFFLSMNFPIYYANNLGNIIGAFDSETKSFLFYDSRTKSGLSCQK